MENLWNDAEASLYKGILGPRVYTSRLLGRENSLVLYGGGNTSLKARPATADVLFVTGSGSDLGRVEAADFVPLDLEATRKIFSVEKCVIGTSAARPSSETMLHAALPFPYVEHTHADSILAVANVEEGEQLLAELYGDLAPTVGYHDSGLELARACLEAFEQRGTARTIGLALRFRGAIAFGHTARDSYENMLRLVSMAEDFLKARNAWEIQVTEPVPAPEDETGLSSLQAAVSRAAGRPLVLHRSRDPLGLAFARRSDLAKVSQQGPATPQHASFTRRVPLIGRDVASYARRYRDYLERHLGDAAASCIDCAPRIVIDPAWGVCAFGDDAAGAAAAAEVYRHDMEIISRASAHGTYCAASAASIAIAETQGIAAPEA